MNEHEKNDLIMRQRQEIARLTLELARVNKPLVPVVDDEVQHELPIDDFDHRKAKNRKLESKAKS